MKKMKMTKKAFASICAAAMAVTLAVPSAAFLKNAPIRAEAAGSDSILDTALMTIDFENGWNIDASGPAMTPESEQRLKLEDGVPVKDASGQYVMVDAVGADGLPTIEEDSEKGKVLKFKDSVKVEQVTAVATDPVDDKEEKYGLVIQQEEHLGGRVKVPENPFAGQTLGNNPGLSISYWVKVPEIYVDDKGEKVSNPTAAQISSNQVKKRGANSTTVVFGNSSRLVKQKDDYAKFLACQGYDEEEALKDTSDYYLGSQEIYTDKDGNAYVVYKDYGKLIRYNPNYPLQNVDAEVSQAAAAAVSKNGVVRDGGWFQKAADSSDESITVYAKDGVTSIEIRSFANKATSDDENQYDLFAYSYAETDDLANGYSSKSRIREEVIKGSLQISTDNDFAFCEDNYRQEPCLDSAGKPSTRPIDGARCMNPVLTGDQYRKFNLFGYQNFFIFDGDEFVTSGKEEDEYYDAELDEDITRPAIQGVGTWHYVTIVMQNDWVTTYVDGVPANPEEDYQYRKESKELTSTQHTFGYGKNVTGQSFNKGKGLKGRFGYASSNVPGWPANGAATSDSPANSLQITMLDWLIDADTELYLGGTSYCAESFGQGYGTIEGVCLDDISFFGKALNKEEAVALYKEARIKKVGVTKGDVNFDGKVTAADAVDILKHYASLVILEGSALTAGDVNGDGKANAADAVLVLKKYAGLITETEWTQITSGQNNN